MRPAILLVLFPLLTTATKWCTKFDVFGDMHAPEFNGIPDRCVELDLFRAGLTDTDAKNIAKALASHPNLKRLGLSENSISEAGAVALAEAVESNRVIEKLKLLDQDVEDGVAEITKATRKRLWKKLKKNEDNVYTKGDDEQLAKQIRMEEVADGVTKHVLKEGSGNTVPGHGANVKVKYQGTLANGDEFDSGTIDFSLGVGKVIKCWDKAFASMVKGEKAFLVCSADQAYGAAGKGSKIKGGATLKFAVELLSFEGASVEVATPEERATQAEQIKKATEKDEKWLAKKSIRRVKVADGLIKHVLKEGKMDDGVKLYPGDGANVKFKYDGKLATGEHIQSGTADFSLGGKHVLPCWETAAWTMQKGETAFLICGPEHAYGSRGDGKKIKPGATVKFLVKVMAIRGITVNEKGVATLSAEGRARVKRDKLAHKAEEAKHKAQEAAEKGMKAEVALKKLEDAKAKEL